MQNTVGGGGDSDVTTASGQAGRGGGLDGVADVGIGARGLRLDRSGWVSNRVCGLSQLEEARLVRGFQLG